MSITRNCSSDVLFAHAVHPASLVDPSTHSPVLMDVIDKGVTAALIEHLINQVLKTVDSTLEIPSAPSSKTVQISRCSAFRRFAIDAIHQANVQVSTILVALVYIARGKPWNIERDREWAYERVLLGALMISHKYTNDAAMKIRHWELPRAKFGEHNLGLMERDFLAALNYRLGVTEVELLDSLPRCSVSLTATTILHRPYVLHPRLVGVRKRTTGKLNGKKSRSGRRRE